MTSPDGPYRDEHSTTTYYSSYNYINTYINGYNPGNSTEYSYDNTQAQNDEYLNHTSGNEIVDNQPEYANSQEYLNAIYDGGEQLHVYTDDKVISWEEDAPTQAQHDYLNNVNSVAEDVIDDNDLQKGYDGTNRTWCNRALDRMLTKLGVNHDAIMDPGERDYKNEHGEESNLQYTNANMMADLAEEASKDPTSGVREITDPEEAQKLANEGNAVIATYRNYDTYTDKDGNVKTKPGHVALIIPDDDYKKNKGPAIAQAGGRNLPPSENAHVSDGFGTKPVKFYILTN